MQSKERQAGTSPNLLIRPLAGFSPTTLHKPAGTRPDPAVSVASVKATWSSATARAEPELEPPDTKSGLYGLAGAVPGTRAPTSPVANWSSAVLPMTRAPAASARATLVADRSGQ